MTDQDYFDLMIGRLDRVLSQMVNCAKDHRDNVSRLENEELQTLKHHAEDMEAAAAKVLECIGACSLEPKPETAPKAGPPYTVKLTYFKTSGKYYSEGTYKSAQLQIYEIFAEVRDMIAEGKRPGLVDGFDFPYVLVTVEDHPHAYPALVFSSKAYTMTAQRRLDCLLHTIIRPNTRPVTTKRILESLGFNDWIKNNHPDEEETLKVSFIKYLDRSIDEANKTAGQSSTSESQD